MRGGGRELRISQLSLDYESQNKFFVFLLLFDYWGNVTIEINGMLDVIVS